MNDPIIVTIDQAGRVVIPKEIREIAGIEPGMPLVISSRDGRIEIEPRRRAVRIEKQGRLQVAVSVDPGTSLTREQVRKAQDAIARRR
jgi:AbrB family looped-hinge helix DNA binding protein